MKITRASCSLLICFCTGALSTLAQTPQVLSVSPSQNRIAQDLLPQIAVTFSTPLDSATFTPINFAVNGERSGYKTGAIQYNQSTVTATFLPSTPLSAGERVTVVLSHGIRSQTGDSLQGFTWTFRIPSARRNELRFADAVVYSGGGWSIQCADMNGDGLPDIVSSGGTIRLNSGSGTFNAFWTLPDADPFSRIAVEDFNRDGIMDVLYNAGGLRIALSEGNGNFNIQSRPWWFDNYIVGDFNSDGFPDIAGVTTSGDAWGISFNNGSSLFPDTVIIGRVQGILTAMEPFDVDNDGDLDILCSGFPINAAGENGIAVWKGNGRGGFDSLRIYISPVFLFPEQLYSSDFSNDGLADIAVRGYVGGLSLNLGGAFGTDTTSTREFWPAEAPGAMTAGDFNGDGWIDLMVSGWRLVPFDTTRFTGYAIIPNCQAIFRSCLPWPEWISDTLGYDYLVRSAQAVDVDNDGDLDMVHSYDAIYVNINTSPPVSVREEPGLPQELHVDQNFPNPFNSETIVRYQVSTAQRIRVQVYDAFGREVRQLQNGVVAPGEHVVRWDGMNENLYRVASGAYLIRFLGSNSTRVLKVLHLK